MRIHTPLVILGLLVAAGTASAGPGPTVPVTPPRTATNVTIPELLSRIPGVGRVYGALVLADQIVRTIDALTEVNHESVRSKLKEFHPTMEFEVCNTYTDVYVTWTNANWRGTVTVNLTMPTKLVWSVDLSKLKPQDLSWDPSSRVLRVRMPDVRISTVAPNLKKHTFSVAYSSGRYAWYDNGDETRLKDKALRDVEKYARDLSQGEFSAARESAKTQVRKLMTTVLESLGHQGDVIVE